MIWSKMLALAGNFNKRKSKYQQGEKIQRLIAYEVITI